MLNFVKKSEKVQIAFKKKERKKRKRIFIVAETEQVFEWKESYPLRLEQKLILPTPASKKKRTIKILNCSIKIC